MVQHSMSLIKDLNNRVEELSNELDHYKEFDKIYGEAAAEYRRSLGLTQKELADICGVNRVTIAKFEAGQIHSPRLSGQLQNMGMKVDFNKIMGGATV